MQISSDKILNKMANEIAKAKVVKDKIKRTCISCACFM